MGPQSQGAYPRRSGGTFPLPLFLLILKGLSPQERGNRTLHAARCTGLSPQERGNRGRCFNALFRGGPIPAGAGEPHVKNLKIYHDGAYPRRSGGTEPIPEARRPCQGLSPQERGNLLSANPAGLLPGPIPAGAGEPTRAITPARRWRAYPRRSGGTGLGALRRPFLRGLSPQERGNHLEPSFFENTQRPIPAGAGEPPQQPRHQKKIRAYPRRSGGT